MGDTAGSSAVRFGVMKKKFWVLRQVTMRTQRNARARPGECRVLGQNALLPLIVFKHVCFFVFDIFGHCFFAHNKLKGKEEGLRMMQNGLLISTSPKCNGNTYGETGDCTVLRQNFTSLTFYYIFFIK